ncbi:hypothetical protein OsI_07379 [Oryza sativa Indica Group]|uniref:Uncharacterized protein n=1 Tax=Oryza sativa subsp. indica TaxID=39946 RepID=B8AIL7_ORYSI|nr:hypothetical protein OsI_07379 [Oryza sativa Indica Group]
MEDPSLGNLVMTGATLGALWWRRWLIQQRWPREKQICHQPPKLEGPSDSDDYGGSELGDNRSDGAGLDRGRFANDDLGSCGASAPMTMAADYDSGNDGLQ